MNRSGPDDELGGPLSGLRVLEFVGIGPGPYCGMLLADLGAEVVRIDRPGGNGWPNSIVDRGRQVIEVDLHTRDGVRIGQLAAQKADVLLEGFRPGVMERLGLGPEQLLHANPVHWLEPPATTSTTSLSLGRWLPWVRQMGRLLPH